MTLLRVRLLAVAVLAAALGCRGEPPAVARPPADPPAIEELRTATYSGLAGIDHPVTLTRGEWEDPDGRQVVTFARDFVVTGDVDGTPPDEAVVVLTVSGPADGVVAHLAVVARGDAGLANIGTVPIGEHVELRAVRVQDRRVVAEVVRPGPDDPACCPGELATLAWSYDGAALRDAPAPGTPARLSLDVVGGEPWVLRAWDADDTAPIEPQITLRWRDGRFEGSAGCNTYTARATPGAQPGDVAIASPTATRKACPDEVMAIEERYLDQLGHVAKYGFLLGQLALTWRVDGRVGVMLFDRQ